MDRGLRSVVVELGPGLLESAYCVVTMTHHEDHEGHEVGWQKSLARTAAGDRRRGVRFAVWLIPSA